MTDARTESTSQGLSAASQRHAEINAADHAADIPARLRRAVRASPRAALAAWAGALVTVGMRFSSVCDNTDTLSRCHRRQRHRGQLWTSVDAGGDPRDSV